MCLFSLSNCQMDYKLHTVAFSYHSLLYSWESILRAFILCILYKISQVVISGIFIAYYLMIFKYMHNIEVTVYFCKTYFTIIYTWMHIYLIIADMYINLKSREDKTYENPYLNL